MYTETIAAISTGLSEAGIGIIRISGSEAVTIADRIYVSPKGKKKLSDEPSHTIHYGFIKENDEILDEVLVSLMRAPRSFTAEDTVEINCHGGVYALRRVLEAALRAGARLAEPGEFTKRAFLNGRVDLSQAEAVMDVIRAKNDYALHNSLHQLKGRISDKVKMVRSELLYHMAKIESALDDPEHYDLGGYDEELSDHVKEWKRQISELLKSADNGRMIQEGIRTVIIGRPNAGKSSLMNSLLGEERAIVTHIAGTTRDTLHETLQMDGLTLNLVDTAGIHETEDEIEKIGVGKAMDIIDEADLILYVVDCSEEMTEDDDRILMKMKGRKSIMLLNKSDLTKQITVEKLQKHYQDVTGSEEVPPVLEVSLKERQMPLQLKNTVRDMFIDGSISFNDEVMITSLRQKKNLEMALKSLEQVERSIADGMPEDFFTIDLMEAYRQLGEMIGSEVSEDLINEIFEKFCMGK